MNRMPCFASPPLSACLGLLLVCLVSPGVFASGTQRAPTLDELKAATYQGIEGTEGPVTLADGEWEGRPYVEGGASRPRVQLARDYVVYGDLDGDGADEAVVFLGWSGGGSGELIHLAVVARQGDAVRNVATARVGDRVQVRAARVEPGSPRAILLAEVVQAGPEDAACCPGEVATRGWRLEPDGSLTAFVPAQAPGRLSLETLAGTEWVLRAWGLDEPAPAEPVVTLAVQDGRFVGRAGCNRYFAQAEPGASPGEVKLGPAGSTRMACPEPVMAVEDRFLAQLAGVRDFGFLMGQLALTYHRDGAVGVMLFDAQAQAAKAERH